MTLPSYVVYVRGYPACPCLAEWIPAYEHELQRRGLLIGPLRIYQLIGDYAGSANTHKDGGAFDLLDLPGDEEIEVAREMGADATWTRPKNWDGKGGVAHDHGVLRGCPHNGPARYQIDAVDAGFNGLGAGGRGGRDTGPRPLSGRTWQEGIAWAHEQEENDMAITEQLEELVRQGEQARRRDVANRKLLKGLADQVTNLGDAVAENTETSEDIKARITKAKRELLDAIAAADEAGQ